MFVCSAAPVTLARAFRLVSVQGFAVTTFSGIHISRDEKIFCVTAEGLLSATTIAALIEAHYPSIGARHVLWDLTAADVSALTERDFVRIAAVAAGAVPRIQERKTAYVARDPTVFLAACKYLNAAVSLAVPREYSVFTTRPEAEAWLGAT